MIKGLTVMIAIIHLALYILLMCSMSTPIQNGVQYWAYYYALGAGWSIGAFLIVMARTLLKMSRKQFKKKEMPTSVR